MFGLFRRKTSDAVPDIDIGGRQIAVAVVRNARARRISLRADAVHGVVRLTLPPRAPIRDALALLDAQRGWIAARVTSWPRPLPFVPGARIPFEGGELLLDWDETNARGVRQIGTTLYVGGPRSTLSGRTTRWLGDLPTPDAIGRMAGERAHREGLVAARPNEAGNYLEPFVRAAMKEMVASMGWQPSQLMRTRWPSWRSSSSTMPCL